MSFPAEPAAVLGTVAGIVLLTVLILRLLSNKLYFRRKNRILAAILLFLAYLAKLSAFFHVLKSRI